MSSVTVITEAMLESLTKGASLQKKVKAFIQEGIEEGKDSAFVASYVADAVGIFKTTVEYEIKKGAYEGDSGTYRKKANNIINDVSRICRDTLGYSIVNYKRSGGKYYYKSVQWVPEARAPRRSAMVKDDLSSPAPEVKYVPQFETMGDLLAYAEGRGWPVIAIPTTASNWVDVMLKTTPLEDLAREVVSRAKMAMGSV